MVFTVTGKIVFFFVVFVVVVVVAAVVVYCFDYTFPKNGYYLEFENWQFL